MEQPNTGNEPEDTPAKPHDASNPTSITEQEKAQLPPAENQNADTDNKPPKQSVWSRWQSHPLSDRVMSYFTGVVAVCAVLQIVILVGGSSQTDLLIKAAQMSAHSADHNAASAQSFAESASLINKGVNEAVARLQAQANVAESARRTSQSSSLEALRATVDNFHQEQRSWIRVTHDGSPFPAVGTTPKMCTWLENTGRTPAKNVSIYSVHIYFAGEYPPGRVTYVKDTLGTIGMGSPICARWERESPISKGEYKVGDNFIVYGAMSYRDVFKKEHWVTFCYYKSQEHDSGYCETHNDFGDGEIPPNELR